MSYVTVNAKQEHTAHTIQEFLSLAMQTRDYPSYDDLAYTEIRDSLEFCTKHIIDDYLYELKQLSETITLADRYIRKYRYNPKLLSYDLYGSTRMYYLILKLNELCNVHEFSIKSKKLILISPDVLKKALTNIYTSENRSLQIYKTAHKNDIIKMDIPKDIFKRDPIAKFWNV